MLIRAFHGDKVNYPQYLINVPIEVLDF